MGKHEAISATVDHQTLADLRRLAEHMGCTVDHLVATAVHRFVNQEIGAVEPDAFADMPGYCDPTPEGRALDEAQDREREAFRAYVKIGTDAADRGEVVSHEEMTRWFADRKADRARAEAAE